jgi:hypothetical protein
MAARQTPDLEIFSFGKQNLTGTDDGNLDP